MYVCCLYNKNQWALTENQFFWSTVKSIFLVNGKINFLVNGKIKFADWPKKQAIFCWQIWWLTNIFMYTFSLTKCTYNFFVARNLMKKVPTIYNVLKTWPPRYRRSRLNEMFILIQWMGILQFRFTKFLYLFRPTKRTFILYIFRPAKCTFFVHF